MFRFFTLLLQNGESLVFYANLIYNEKERILTDSVKDNRLLKKRSWLL